VPGGNHAVEFRYDSRAIAAGFALSALGIAALAFARRRLTITPID
jgi:hypothetical protein